MNYTILELVAYLIIYSFLGWLLEVCIVAIKDRRFRNRGLTNLPFCLMYGIMMDILIIIWPQMAGHGLFKWIAAFAVFVVVQSLSEFFVGRICQRMLWKYEDITPYNGQWLNLLVAIMFTALLWCGAELLHPLLFLFIHILPEIVVQIFCGVVGSVLILDSLLTLYVMLRNRGNRKVIEYQQKQQEYQSGVNGKIYELVWGRIEKAYPNMEEDPNAGTKYVFAKGICMDKIIWLFLISALLGDIIETFYCRIVGGVWMSRSSVLYGPFSIVWGLGAVVLTLVLCRFAHKADRYIFLIGALLGGVYEYVCSVFTEVVFGTVFWDYSHMMFNIGGRTNLLYMIFWGILSVVWIKIIYPRLSNVIEKIPPLSGKIITWVLIAFMICNALVSALAMARYTERQDGIEASNIIEEFLDITYQDELIERVWPNMKITE